MTDLHYLIKLLPHFPACFIYTPFVILSIFVALSNFRRLIKLLSSSHPFLSTQLLRYLRTLKMYLRFTPNTQLSLPSYQAHVLCANTRFQHNRRLWPLGHSDVRGSRHDWGFYPRTNSCYRIWVSCCTYKG